MMRRRFDTSGAANQGDAAAQLQVGLRLGREGPAKDENAAAAYFRRGADQGVAPAQVLFAMCLSDGIGVPKNDEARGRSGR
jgi:TPR repeat protein